MQLMTYIIQYFKMLDHLLMLILRVAYLNYVRRVGSGEKVIHEHRVGQGGAAPPEGSRRDPSLEAIFPPL